MALTQHFINKNLVISLDGWALLFKNTKNDYPGSIPRISTPCYFFLIIEGIAPLKNLMAQYTTISIMPRGMLKKLFPEFIFL